MGDQPELFGPTTGPGGGPLAIALRDAEPLLLWRRWLDDSPAWLERLVQGIPWEDHTLRTPGGRIPAPRRECWFATTEGEPYTYSGETYRSRALDEVSGLSLLRDRVSATTGIAFDALFANLYRNNRDSIGWHSDAEPVLGPAEGIVIASLSLGARRRFSVQHRTSSERVDLDLGEGDLLLMGRGSQGRYLHQAPKTSRAVGTRLNLTFRRLVGRSR